MPRPCTCDEIATNGVYDTTQCRLCWLYHHDSSYRKLWGESKKKRIINPNKPRIAKGKKFG